MGIGWACLDGVDELNKARQYVTVYEFSDWSGGLMMYGVPNLETDKIDVVQWLVVLMAEEVFNFFVNENVGVDSLFSEEKLHIENDALLWACGAIKPSYTSIFDSNSRAYGLNTWESVMELLDWGNTTF